MVRRCHVQRGSLLVEWFFTFKIAAWRECSCSSKRPTTKHSSRFCGLLYAGELARAGQSNRRRAGTGSASPECATRPPLWPAGMAGGNHETFGSRVGLSSHGSPAKCGPKLKCLARLKIARTSARPPSLTISDLSRFPFFSFCLAGD